MKHTIAIVAATVIGILCVHTAYGAVVKWRYTLGTGAVMHDIVPDGKGGGVLCYSIAASNAVYVTYLDKNGVSPVWHKTFSGFNIVRSKFIAANKAIVSLYPSSGETEVREIDMKTGDERPLEADTGCSYTADATTGNGNRDTKGFFIFMKTIATGEAQIIRYSNK